MTEPNWTPPLTKMRLYEAFCLLNRSFEATIEAVDQLQRLDFFANADLPVLMDRLEFLRAETNANLAENMQDYEHDEAFRFEKLVSQFEKSISDPNELYLRSQEHKQGLREQIKELQDALNIQGGKRKASKRGASKRRPRKRRKATRAPAKQEK